MCNDVHNNKLHGWLRGKGFNYKTRRFLLVALEVAAIAAIVYVLVSAR